MWVQILVLTLSGMAGNPVDFESLLRGRYPERRHDGSDWRESDVGRASFAGQAMSVPGVCLFVKGDWAELVQRWGFPGWNDAAAPCPHCHTDLASLFSLRGYSPLSMPAPEKTIEDYANSCASVEHHRSLTAAQCRLVRPNLVFKTGGRVLKCDIPSLGLLKWGSSGADCR